MNEMLYLYNELPMSNHQVLIYGIMGCFCASKATEVVFVSPSKIVLVTLLLTTPFF